MGNCPANHGCGGCFSQFYVAGTIVRRGEAERLYDQPYFRHLQESMRDDPLRSLYPPTLGLLMAPLAWLSYHEAMAAWWAIQAVCILATGVIFYRTTPAAAALADQYARGPGRAGAVVDRRGHRPIVADVPAGAGRRIDAAQAGKMRLGRAGCSRCWP